MNGFEKAQRMRRELGRELKERRKAAGISQAELARLTGKSRSMISTLESSAGGAAGLGFWQRCDELFRTGGRFARRWLQIQREVDAEKGRAAAARREAAASRATATGAPGRVLRALVSGQMSVAEAEAAYTEMGWPLLAGQPSPELVTGKVADALEVLRPAGMLAITWWLDSRGAADTIRNLPALPPPEESLAVIAAGPVLYFLTRSGASPWPGAGSSRPIRPARGAPVIGWHSGGSAVPLPPAQLGDGRSAQWMHLPVRAMRLASPFAVLDLLAKAVIATGRVPEAISLAGGVLAVQSSRPEQQPDLG